jgi:peptidoglycan hydrolase CwlO-like protein
LKGERKEMAMFYSDNPARDWDDYCEYQERLNKEWHEENDPRMQEEIDEIEYKIENLKIDLKNATDEDKKWDIECNIEELQNDIKKIRKEMEEEY